jgi:hypothetical protein
MPRRQDFLLGLRTRIVVIGLFTHEHPNSMEEAYFYFNYIARGDLIY